ncbi:MAG: F0F1 ATP synthase subunit A [Kiritimatiellia bacterium]
MQEKLEAFLEFVQKDVLHHWGTLDAITHKNWLSDLGHDTLAIFHFDATMLIVLTLLLCILAFVGRRQIGQLPRGFGIVLEKYVLFIRDEMVYPNFGGKAGKKYVPYFCTTFIFILMANLLGLIPVFTCATGNINVTAALALIFLSVALTVTVRAGGVKGFISAFVPGGLPKAMRPLMFVMEIVSLLTRTFALTIRLFANMMGGHIVLYSMISLTAIVGAVATPSILIAVCLYFLEVFVAFLQAYVFTMLATIFTGMMVHPEH